MTSDESLHDRAGGDDTEHLDALAAFGDTLRSVAVWDEPPGDLADRIVGAVQGQPGAEPGPGEAAPATPSPPVRLDERRRRHNWLVPGLAAAAAAAVAFAAGLLAGGDDDEAVADPIADVELAPAAAATDDAVATGTVVDAGAGYAIRLRVSGLEPAAKGEYYEGWLYDETTGDWVSIGTFHMRGGDDDVLLWSGVPIARYGELIVTSEIEGGAGDEDRGRAVLEGPVIRR